MYWKNFVFKHWHTIIQCIKNHSNIFKVFNGINRCEIRWYLFSIQKTNLNKDERIQFSFLVAFWSWHIHWKLQKTGKINMIWKPNCTNERCWKRLFTKLCIMIYMHNKCIKLCIIHIRVYSIHIKIYVIKLLCMIIYFISFWYHMLFITSHKCIWKTYFFFKSSYWYK